MVKRIQRKQQQEGGRQQQHLFCCFFVFQRHHVTSRVENIAKSNVGKRAKKKKVTENPKKPEIG